MMKKLIFFLVSLVFYAHSAFASCTVYLKSGNTFTGNSCEVTDNAVYLNTGGGRMWWFKSDIAAVKDPSLSRNHAPHHQERNRAERCKYLKLSGYPDCRLPYGYEVDHIVPLCSGGPDVAENMQLLSIQSHDEKTRRDAAMYGGRCSPSPND